MGVIGGGSILGSKAVALAVPSLPSPLFWWQYPAPYPPGITLKHSLRPSCSPSLSSASFSPPTQKPGPCFIFLSQDSDHFAYICSYLVFFSFFVWCPYPLWIGLQFLVTHCDECVFLARSGQAPVAMSAQYISSLGNLTQAGNWDLWSRQPWRRTGRNHSHQSLSSGEWLTVEGEREREEPNRRAGKCAKDFLFPVAAPSCSFTVSLSSDLMRLPYTYLTHKIMYISRIYRCITMHIHRHVKIHF